MNMVKKSKTKKPPASRAALVLAVVIGLVSLIVATIVVIKYVQRNTLAKEEAAFLTMLSRAEDMVDSMVLEHVDTVATDSSKSCYYETKEKFGKEKLYCRIDTTAYYRVADIEVAKQLAEVIQANYSEKFSEGLKNRSENPRPDKVILDSPFVKIDKLEDIKCAASVLYPHILQEYKAMPGRTFDEKNVLHFSISCVKQVREPFFQLLTDETDYF